MRRAPHDTPLSCYTAGIAHYLDTEGVSGPDVVADSARLAVEPGRDDGLLAFSQHALPLDRLPNGDRLVPWGSSDPDEARALLADQVHRYGRALVVASTDRLPWSAAGDDGRGAVSGAPHVLVVGGTDPTGWHVTDRFTGTLGNGQVQESVSGRVPDADLASVIRRPDRTDPVHHLRNQLAFGHPVPVPEPAPFLLLVRQPGPGPEPVPLGAGWVVGTAATLRALAGQLDDPDTLLAQSAVVDDIWAAAVHHQARYRAAGTAAAADAWNDLPRALRFALDSTRRGRPRTSLVADRLLGLAAAVDTAETTLARDGATR